MSNSTVTIDLKEYTLLDHMSMYNRNYHQCRENDRIIFIESDDDNWNDFYIIPNIAKPQERIFLFGCCTTDIHDDVATGYLFMEYF